MRDGRYPLPERVAAYGDRAAFEACRKESGQWVFWEDRVELVLQGRYDEVRPLHVELSPTFLCNFACPWCSCRTAREDWSDEDVFNHPLATAQTVMSREKLDRVLEHMIPDRIGIMWVGGEPTMHPALYSAAIALRDVGLSQCLFTNGSVLSEKRIDALLSADLVFIRVSLDAASDSVHQLHHGYRTEHSYAQRVKRNLETLVRRRKERGAKTLVGVSLVVDERNLDDVVPTAAWVRQLCDRWGAGAVDYLIVRPTYQFYAAQIVLSATTRGRLQALVDNGAVVRELLSPFGVKVVAPRHSFAAPDEPLQESTGDRCLAHAWFSEVNPNGDMLACSDRYGNPNYFIGNLATESVNDIWSGSRRADVLRWIEGERCFRNHCPRNGRGFQFNRLFHQIEALRRDGKIDQVRVWIDDLRRVLPRPEHPFFL